MKIKRFVAKTMRQALRQVREEQGPDAVILSNRSVDGGVEVVAAVDYDETLMARAVAEAPEVEARLGGPVDTDDVGDVRDATSPAPEASSFESFMKVAAAVAPPAPAPAPSVALDLSTDPTVQALKAQINAMRTLLEDQLATLVWRDQASVSTERAGLLRKFSEIGLDPDIAKQTTARTLEAFDSAHATAEYLNVLAGSLPVLQEDLCDEGGIFAVVGPTGVGKTTTIAKLAARFAIKHGRDALALVSTDTFRIGAQEQLATFAQILDVPVHMARDRAELQTVLKGLSSRRLVLIDTAGVSQRDNALGAALGVLDDDDIRPRRLLALPANVQRDTQTEVVERFSQQPLHGLIITKLDEAASFGATFSTVLRHDIPVAYLADGQRVPEDLHVAGPKRQWWVNEANRRRDTSGRRSDEQVLAQQFSEVIEHAHA